MNRKALLTILLIISLLIGGFEYLNRRGSSNVDVDTDVNTTNTSQNEVESPSEEVVEENKALKEKVDLTYPSSYTIDADYHVYQTFNNCGPATLTMALRYYNRNVNQQALGNTLRPYQNQSGDNDDKAIFSYEIVEETQRNGLNALYRPNGDMEKIKILVSNDIPIILKTWLNPYEDIGHFVLVKGYNDNNNTLILNDSYNGPNIERSYSYINNLWQPFNYEYIVVYSNEKEDIVQRALKEDYIMENAWDNALDRAYNENTNSNFYPLFNASIANYYLGNYEQAVEEYEEVANRLPGRMLWYHYEPIKAYYHLEEYQTALTMIENILNNGNRAYSELYKIRGDIYRNQGDYQQAEAQYNLALRYNSNYEEAREALNELNDLQ